MKKYVIIVTMLLSITLQMIAAEYQYIPMVREGVELSYYIDFRDSYTHAKLDDTEYFRLFIQGDTIINNIEYKKVYYINSEDNIPFSIGAIREEDKKVYSIITASRSMIKIAIQKTPMYSVAMDPAEERSEVMVFDFNKKLNEETGDSLYNGYNLSIVSVEQIEINGTLRNKYTLNHGYDVIEGIGFLNSDYLCWFEIYFDCPCYMKLYLNYERDLSTGEIVYKSKYFDGDDPALGVDDVVTDRRQSTKVVVICEEVKVSVYTDGNYRVDIVDLSGRTVRSANFDGSYATGYVSTSGLTKGTYIVTVTTTEGKSSHKIVVK